MASNITVDTLTKGSTTLNTDEIVDTNSSQVCKAWVNFNATGTVAIRDSHNVSSIIDNAVGTYTVNLTNVMASALNYSVSGNSISSFNTGEQSFNVIAQYPKDASSYYTLARRIDNNSNTFVTVDPTYLQSVVFGD